MASERLSEKELERIREDAGLVVTGNAGRVVGLVDYCRRLRSLLLIVHAAWTGGVFKPSDRIGSLPDALREVEAIRSEARDKKENENRSEP